MRIYIVVDIMRVFILFLVAIFATSCSTKLKEDINDWKNIATGYKPIPEPIVLWQDYTGCLTGPLYRGWIPKCDSFDKAIVVSHANPRVGIKLEAVDSNSERVVRTVVKTVKLNLIDSKQMFNGDVVVCTVDRPWPDTITGYEIAKTVKDGSSIIVWRKGNKPETAWVAKNKGSEEYLMLKDSESGIWYGDSGGPWFVIQGKMYVVGHFTLGGMMPTSINYTMFRKQIEREIND